MKMESVVSLIRTPDSEDGIRNSLAQALELINFKPNDKIQSVSIKPNLCYYWNASTGYTTDPRIVAGLIDLVRETFGSNVQIRVVEADATAMRTKHVFQMLGYRKMAKEKNVELLNLCEDSLEERRTRINQREIRFQVPQSLLKADLFINVPKLKVMRATQITCALKNIFGCIGTPRKIVYHPFLDEAIVAINKILHPHLTIVDGIVALGRFPVKLNLIMAATDPFAIDWTASRIMGYDPSKIGFMKLALKEKLGNPDAVSTVGQDVESLKRIFPHPGAFSSKLWNLQLRLLKTYHVITGDIIPPILEEEH